VNHDRVIDEFASRQYGTFSRQQAERAGFTSRMILTRVQNGAWIRLAPAVYALASAPPKWERQMAAALLTRDGSIVAGRSAAYIHRFDGFSQGRPVIMIGAEGNARSPLAKVIRSKRFDTVDRERKLGFVVTSEAETVMTLAAVFDRDRLEALVDSLIARGSCSVDALATVVAANRGARGVARLRPVVAHRLPDAYQPPTSELERLLYRILDDPRLPPHTRQLPMAFHRVDATVDAYVDRWTLIIEGDGRRWHNRRADHDRDRLRDNEAVAHGYAVLRFTYEMLRDHAEQVIDTLVRTGRVRQPLR
jgi:very-short-patch-repair endonuclease